MPKLSLVLPGSIRSKKNSKRIFARGRIKTVLPSTGYLQWEKRARKDVGAYIIHACSLPKNGLPRLPNDLQVHVTAMIYYKGPRPDLSGCLESIGDCLEGLVWENDTQIVSWDGSRLVHDIVNPFTEVEIWWPDYPMTEADEKIIRETGI